jgi:hypothetical protein
MGKHVIGLLILVGLVLLTGCAPTATPVPTPTSPAASPTAAVPPSPTATPAPPTDTPLPPATDCHAVAHCDRGPNNRGRINGGRSGYSSRRSFRTGPAAS